MQKRIKILLIPLAIVFVYLIIFFCVFIFKKGDLNDIDNSKIQNTNQQIYGYGQTATTSTTRKNSEYSSIFSPKFGNSNAKINVVVFYDFDCYYSWQEYSILYNIIKKYYDKGYFEFRNFPLESIHPNSKKLANAAMCANEQERFLEMFNEIYSHFEDRQSSTSSIDDLIKQYAKNAELDINKFDRCMRDLIYDKIINKDMIDAINSGVEGTPTFFINGLKYPGVIKQEDWENIFKSIK